MRHLVLPLSLLTALACEGGGTATDAESQSALGVSNLSLEADNGGFSEADTDPALSAVDEALDDYAADDLSAPVDDTTPEPSGANVARYELRLTWGHPGRPDLELTPPAKGAYDRDWDGTVTTTSGSLRVRRVIRFEGADKLLPREAPNVVAFESTTRGHVDGLLLSLAVPEDAEGELVVQLEGLPEMRLPHAKLRRHVSARKVDDLGNGVSLIAFADAGCAKATAGGHWLRTGRRGGVFSGAVDAVDGSRAGRLVGIWGVRKDGERRFYGLYLRDGEPAARVRGRWIGLPNVPGGFFRGHVVTKAGHQGLLMGHFRTEAGLPDGAVGAVPAAGKKGGVFHAFYVGACADEVVASDAPESGAEDLCADGLCVSEPQASCAEASGCEDITDAL